MQRSSFTSARPLSDAATRAVRAAAVALLSLLLLHTGPLKSTADEPTNASFLNNVVSTSLQTPGAALQIPIAETVQVRGQVFGADGTPAENAVVWAASIFPEPPHRERTVTDDQGNFLLHLKPLTGKHDRWMIAAFKDDASVRFKDSLKWINDPESQQPHLLTARLVPRSVAQLKILAREDSSPVKQARLFLSDGRVLMGDSEGNVRVAGLQSGNHSMVVMAPNRQRRYMFFDNTLCEDMELNVHLEKAGRVEGFVVDENDDPVPHAWVKRMTSGAAVTLDGLCALADEAGRFRWEGILPDQVVRELTAGKDGFETSDVSMLSLDGQNTTEVVFRLRPQQSATPAPSDASQPQDDAAPRQSYSNRLPLRDLQGVVLDQNREAVQDATVRWGATAYEAIDRETQTGPAGRFRLDQVPDRKGYVTVIANGFAPQFVEIEDGATEISVRLKRGTKVGGKVVNASGTAVAGVSVIPMIGSPDPSLCNPLWIVERQATTDPNGLFLIKGLPDSGVFLDFRHPALSDLNSQSIELGRLGHVIKMNSRGAFCGRVVDPDGNPVSDFCVQLGFPLNRKPTDRNVGFRAAYGSIGTSYTRPDGRFVWGDDVTPGAVYRVSVSAPGFAKCSVDRVLANSIDTLDLSDPILFQLSQPTTLRVNVADQESGKPIRDAKVSLIDRRQTLDQGRFRWSIDDTYGKFQVSDQQGEVVFDALTSREGTVAIQSPGYARQRFGWRNGERAFRVTMVPESLVLGSVRDVKGQPMHDLYISLLAEDRSSYWRRLDSSSRGEFQFGQLPAGKYNLILNDERRELANLEFEVATEQSVDVSFIVDKKTGKVRSKDVRHFPDEPDATVRQTGVEVID